MAKIDYKKAQAELFKRTEGYAANIRAVYRDVMMQIINLVKNTDLESESHSPLLIMGIASK